MTKQAFLSLWAAAIALTAPGVLAEQSERPDLTGTWTNVSRTGLTRPQGVDSLVVSKAEADRIVAGMGVADLSAEDADTDDVVDPNKGAPEAGARDFGIRGYDGFWTDPGSSLALVKGEYRTSYIIDPENGQVPRLKEPKIKFKNRNFGLRYVTGEADNANPEELPLAERCLIGFGNTGGPGMQSTLYNSNYQFVHTEDHLMIMVEMVHDARIIPLFDSAEEARANHRPDEIKPWLGDSVGWYEGDTVVVETINYHPLQVEHGSIKITEDGKLTERFTRYSDREIVYQFTVDDPNFYSQPWTAELSFYATDGQVYEYACHEGNYAMTNILAGARAKEREEADQ